MNCGADLMSCTARSLAIAAGLPWAISADILARVLRWMGLTGVQSGSGGALLATLISVAAVVGWFSSISSSNDFVPINSTMHRNTEFG